MAYKTGIIYPPNFKLRGERCEHKCKQYHAIFLRFNYEPFTYDDIRDITTVSDLMNHAGDSWFVKCGRGKSSIKNRANIKSNTAVWKLHPLCRPFVEKILNVELTHGQILDAVPPSQARA